MSNIIADMAGTVIKFFYVLLVFVLILAMFYSIPLIFATIFIIVALGDKYGILFYLIFIPVLLAIILAIQLLVRVFGRMNTKEKIGTVVVVYCLLLMGSLALTYGLGVFQTQKITPAPSQSYIQTVIVSQDSIQQTIDSLEFVLIPDGEFDMGSPLNEAGRYDNEGPVHHVNISKAFYISKYEVTQKQWRDVMGRSFNGDNLPVETVSWNDVQNFIKKLNDKEGGNKYRLPTEAEWEYAARAGTTSRYFFGDEDSKLGDYAWYNPNSNLRTHDVGQKKPNPWGLYDMYGNVREWVQDEYHGNYTGAPTDGSSWESGSSSDRVVRGGTCGTSDRYCRSANRYAYDPGRDGNMGLGFRLVRDL